MSVSWYAARVQPGASKVASENLFLQGFKNYVPIGKEWREARRGKPAGLAENILFPGYIFVQFDIEDYRWREINRSRGISRLLPLHSESPLSLRVGFIEDLIDQQNAGALDVKRASEIVYSYAKGDMVEALGGVFQGHVGAFERRRKGMLVIVMGLFNSNIEVEIPSHQARPASGDGRTTIKTSTVAPQFGRRNDPRVRAGA